MHSGTKSRKASTSIPLRVSFGLSDGENRCKYDAVEENTQRNANQDWFDQVGLSGKIAVPFNYPYCGVIQKEILV